jgi:hypothetical protein
MKCTCITNTIRIGSEPWLVTIVCGTHPKHDFVKLDKRWKGLVSHYDAQARGVTFWGLNRIAVAGYLTKSARQAVLAHEIGHVIAHQVGLDAHDEATANYFADVIRHMGNVLGRALLSGSTR